LAADRAGADLEAAAAMSLVIFPVKPQDETRLVTVDFVGRMSPTDSIVAANCWVEMHGGVDFKPSAILSGVASWSGTEVSQMVTLGEIGNIYRLSFQVTTAQGQTLQMSGFLVIIPDVIDSVPYLNGLPQYLPSGF
jgi:hypothetical protein